MAPLEGSRQVRGDSSRSQDHGAARPRRPPACCPGAGPRPDAAGPGAGRPGPHILEAPRKTGRTGHAADVTLLTSPPYPPHPGGTVPVASHVMASLPCVLRGQRQHGSLRGQGSCPSSCTAPLGGGDCCSPTLRPHPNSMQSGVLAPSTGHGSAWAHGHSDPGRACPHAGGTGAPGPGLGCSVWSLPCPLPGASRSTGPAQRTVCVRKPSPRT